MVVARRYGALHEMFLKKPDDNLQHLRNGQVVRGEIQITLTPSAFKPQQLLGAGLIRPISTPLAAIHRRYLDVEVDQCVGLTAPGPQVADTGMFLHY